MTYEYTAYVSSERVNSGNEVLRVTAEGEFIWNENADEMIESGDYTQYPALRYVLMALRENERLREAVKAEREACAKLCDELRDEDGFEPYGTECAAAIRARGEV